MLLANSASSTHFISIQVSYVAMSFASMSLDFMKSPCHSHLPSASITSMPADCPSATLHNPQNQVQLALHLLFPLQTRHNHERLSARYRFRNRCLNTCYLARPYVWTLEWWLMATYHQVKSVNPTVTVSASSEQLKEHNNLTFTLIVSALFFPSPTTPHSSTNGHRAICIQSSNA